MPVIVWAFAAVSGMVGSYFTGRASMIYAPGAGVSANVPTPQKFSPLNAAIIVAGMFGLAVLLKNSKGLLK